MIAFKILLLQAIFLFMEGARRTESLDVRISNEGTREVSCRIEGEISGGKATLVGFCPVPLGLLIQALKAVTDRAAVLAQW